MSPHCKLKCDSYVYSLQAEVWQLCLLTASWSLTVMSPPCKQKCDSYVSSLQVEVWQLYLPPLSRSVTVVSPQCKQKCDINVSSLQAEVWQLCLLPASRSVTIVSRSCKQKCDSYVSWLSAGLEWGWAGDPIRPAELIADCWRLLCYPPISQLGHNNSATHPENPGRGQCIWKGHRPSADLK